MTHRTRIEPPTVADVEAMARLDGIELRDGEATDLLATVATLVEAAAGAEERETLQLSVRDGARDPGRRPTAKEDPYNAFIRTCLVEGEADGPLAGRTAAVKDNIAVAGVPMTEGSHFPAFTPAVAFVTNARSVAGAFRYRASSARALARRAGRRRSRKSIGSHSRSRWCAW